MSHITTGINVNGGHGFGGVDHQIAAGLELNLAPQRLLNLILNTIEVKNGALTGVILDARLGIGHELLGELHHLEVVFPRVDTHLLDIITHQVTQGADKQRQVAIDNARRRCGHHAFTDFTPETQQKVHIGEQLVPAHVLGGSTHDEATGNLNLLLALAQLDQLAQSLTLLLILDTLGNTVMGGFGHVDQMT